MAQMHDAAVIHAQEGCKKPVQPQLANLEAAHCMHAYLGILLWQSRKLTLVLTALTAPERFAASPPLAAALPLCIDVHMYITHGRT